MFVAGALLSTGAVAELARRLSDVGESEMAQTIGFAVDGNQDELVVAPKEERAIVAVLEDCPADLEPLRLALRVRA